MPNIGPLEIAIVLVIVLIIFGPKRLPELGRSMGKGLREFKGSITGDDDKDDDDKRAELQASQTGANPTGAGTASDDGEAVEGEVVSPQNKS
jgi:sec-independent protein translocase protein TatA